MIEKRGDELRAYFRTIIRSFWFMRDVKNFEYLRDLEKKLRRSNTHNEDERGVVRHRHRPNGGKAVRCHRRRHRPGSCATNRRRHGEVWQTVEANVAKDILRDDAVKQAYREVSGRAELKAPFGIALAAQEKYGF